MQRADDGDLGCIVSGSGLEIANINDFVFDEKERRWGKVYLWDLSECDEKFYCRHQEGAPIRLIDVNLGVSRLVADSDFNFDNCVKLSPHIKLSSMLIHVIDKYGERAI